MRVKCIQQTFEQFPIVILKEISEVSYSYEPILNKE